MSQLLLDAEAKIMEFVSQRSASEDFIINCLVNAGIPKNVGENAVTRLLRRGEIVVTSCGMPRILKKGSK